MDKESLKRRKALLAAIPVKLAGRIEGLAEAGAKGCALTPVEIQEICRALQGRLDRVPTHFHSGT